MVNVTPFCGKNKYVLKMEKDHHEDISIKNLTGLVEKNVIDAINQEIIENIGNFYVLNYNLLFDLLVRSYALAIDKQKMEKRLIRLRQLGIVNMYQQEKSEQCVYVLSEGASIYYNLQKGEKRKRQSFRAKKELDGMLINHVVPINSLYINAKNIKGATIERKPIVNMYIRLFILDLQWIKVNIATRTIRRNDNVKEIIDELEQISYKYYRGTSYYTVLLCEDSKHIIDVNNEIKNNEIDVPSNMYFTTDRESMFGFLSGLYSRDSDNANTVNSIHFKLS